MQNQAEIKALNSISNSGLFDRAKKAVSQETGATLRVLYVLREIDRRKAFAEKSYSSLFEFCVEFLGYKRDATARRISAMRALKDLPEIEGNIEDGSLTLSTIAQAQSYFTRQKKSGKPLGKSEKLSLIRSIEGKSTRQIDELFLELVPPEPPRESLRPFNSEFSEITLPWPKRVQEKLEKLKSLMSAERSRVESIEAIEAGLDAAIKNCEKKLAKSLEIVSAGTETHSKSIHVRRVIRQNANYQCTFIDSVSGLRCTSKSHLENDHIKPRAKGGKDVIQNVRLLCRNHNIFAAIKEFGMAKMSRYVEADSTMSDCFKSNSTTAHYLKSDST